MILNLQKDRSNFNCAMTVKKFSLENDQNHFLVPQTSICISRRPCPASNAKDLPHADPYVGLSSETNLLYALSAGIAKHAGYVWGYTRVNFRHQVAYRATRSLPRYTPYNYISPLLPQGTLCHLSIVGSTKPLVLIKKSPRS